LHIDGDHTYGAVKADYLNYARMVRPGGIIAMHDLLTPGVSGFVLDLEASGHKIEKIIDSCHVGTAWEVAR
jgi:predicted O-methyltransferase YrrM